MDHLSYLNQVFDQLEYMDANDISNDEYRATREKNTSPVKVIFKTSRTGRRLHPTIQEYSDRSGSSGFPASSRSLGSWSVEELAEDVNSGSKLKMPIECTRTVGNKDKPTFRNLRNVEPEIKKGIKRNVSGEPVNTTIRQINLKTNKYDGEEEVTVSNGEKKESNDDNKKQGGNTTDDVRGRKKKTIPQEICDGDATEGDNGDDKDVTIRGVKGDDSEREVMKKVYFVKNNECGKVQEPEVYTFHLKYPNSDSKTEDLLCFVPNGDTSSLGFQWEQSNISIIETDSSDSLKDEVIEISEEVLEDNNCDDGKASYGWIGIGIHENTSNSDELIVDEGTFDIPTNIQDLQEPIPKSNYNQFDFLSPFNIELVVDDEDSISGLNTLHPSGGTSTLIEHNREENDEQKDGVIMNQYTNEIKSVVLINKDADLDGAAEQEIQLQLLEPISEIENNIFLQFEAFCNQNGNTVGEKDITLSEGEKHLVVRDSDTAEILEIQEKIDHDSMVDGTFERGKYVEDHQKLINNHITFKKTSCYEKTSRKPKNSNLNANIRTFNAKETRKYKSEELNPIQTANNEGNELRKVITKNQGIIGSQKNPFKILKILGSQDKNDFKSHCIQDQTNKNITEVKGNIIKMEAIYKIPITSLDKYKKTVTEKGKRRMEGNCEVEIVTGLRNEIVSDESEDLAASKIGSKIEVIANVIGCGGDEGQFDNQMTCDNELD